VCGARSYTAHVDGRKDEAGRDLVWCDACKRDTPHQAAINTDPGIGPNARYTSGDLRLPRCGRRASDERDAERSPARRRTRRVLSRLRRERCGVRGRQLARLSAFVFAELKRARGLEDPMVTFRRREPDLARRRRPLRRAWRARHGRAAEPRRRRARTLLRAGAETDLDSCASASRRKLPPTVAPLLIHEMAARDPVRRAEWIASLLEHPQGVVRQAAQRDLDGSKPGTCSRCSRSTRRTSASDARLAAIELAAGVLDPRTTEVLIAHLDDPRRASRVRR
jgi:hypothetical protein